ncbi:hypothetical protein, partial [Dyella sp. C11]|uniref:hypothetical protein n=1 Tax=Dyella sp. C11 TaxID=2126991 RepID=UPI001E304F85
FFGVGEVGGLLLDARHGYALPVTRYPLPIEHSRGLLSAISVMFAMASLFLTGVLAMTSRALIVILATTILSLTTILAMTFVPLTVIPAKAGIQ